MTAETYLSQIRLLERILEHKHDEIERLQDKEDYRGVDYSQIRTKGKSSIIDSMAEGIAVKDELARELKKEFSAIFHKREEIIRDIEQIENVNTYSVIYAHYVNGYSLQDIADRESHSKSWAKLHREKGLAIIQGIIDSRT